MFNFKNILVLILYLFIGFKTFAQIDFNAKVLQKDSNTPIPYANICWQDVVNSQLKGYAISDENGFFSISNQTNQEIIIVVSCIGYKTYTDTLNLNKLQTIYLSEDILNLEQVTVTGTRTPYSLKKAPVLTQVVTNKEIEKTNATTVLEALESEIPGIETARYGYGPALNMQGLDAGYTLVLMDGERIAGETDGNIDYSKINTGNIERIEVVRGASSTLYGSNAMGGVINIITKKPKNKIDFKIDLRYDQLNEKNYSGSELDMIDDGDYRLYLRNHDLPSLNGNLNLGIRNKHFYSNTYINFKSADAYQLYDSKSIKKYYPAYDTTVISNENINRATASINGYWDYTLQQKVGYEKDKWKYEIRANYYQHEEFDFDNNNIHNVYKNYTVGGNSSYDINDNHTLNFTINHDTYNKYDAYDKTEQSKHNYRQTFNNIKLNYNLKTFKKHNILLGLEDFMEELESDMFDTTGLMSLKNTNDLVFLIQDEYNISSKFMVIAGFRNSWHSEYKYHITPSISAKYSIKPFNLRLTYARGFRSPSLKELYMNWDHLGMFEIKGNTNLKPEENNYYSFSTEYLNSEYNLSIVTIVSYNQIFNKIGGYWAGNNQDVYYYSNISQQDLFNFESLLKWRILKNINIKGGYVYTKITDNSDNVEQSAISPHSITSHLEYNYNKGKYNLTASISGKIKSKKEYAVQAEEDEIFPGEYYQVEYPAYSIWDFNIYQKYSNYSLKLGVKNIFDYVAPIANFNTSASPGRKFYLSIGYKF